MTAMELELKKSKLQKAISMLDSEEDVNRVEKYLHRMTRREQPPCQFTVEELRKELKIAEEEARQGLGCTTEELRKQPPCQYTIEELKKHLEEAEEDFREGRYYTTEEVRAYFHKKYQI